MSAVSLVQSRIISAPSSRAVIIDGQKADKIPKRRLNEDSNLVTDEIRDHIKKTKPLHLQENKLTSQSDLVSGVTSLKTKNLSRSVISQLFGPKSSASK